MLPESVQLDLFGMGSVSPDPSVISSKDIATDQPHIQTHSRDPTGEGSRTTGYILNDESKKLADSLHRKSRELVQKSYSKRNQE